MRPEDYFYGSVTVGDRGQIVIPAEARAELDIKPGDKLLIMRHPVHEGLQIAKFDAMVDFLREFQEQVTRWKSESDAEVQS